MVQLSHLDDSAMILVKDLLSQGKGGAYLLVGRLSDQFRSGLRSLWRAIDLDRANFIILPGDLENDLSYSIAGVRLIQRFLTLRGRGGKSRVVVWEDAHLLTREAGAALLKTLEEAIASCFFLLFSHRPDLVLPTVRSRCRLYLIKNQTAAEAELPQIAQVISLPIWRRIKIIEGLTRKDTQAPLNLIQAWMKELVKNPHTNFSQRERAVMLDKLGELWRLYEKTPSLNIKLAVQLLAVSI